MELMKKQEQRQIVDLDEFDSEISLFQLIPCGIGRRLKFLRHMVDSILNNSHSRKGFKPISLLITGTQGKRTHGRCFLRALGIEQICEMPSSLVYPAPAIQDFFDEPTPSKGYLISDVKSMHYLVQVNIYDIIKKGEYSLPNYMRHGNPTQPVPSHIVLTAKDKEDMPEAIADAVTHSFEMEDYTDLQLELAALQRLKYAGIDYDGEELLTNIVKIGERNLHSMVKLMETAITLMLSESRTTLNLKDVENAIAHVH